MVCSAKCPQNVLETALLTTMLSKQTLVKQDTVLILI